MFAAMKHVDVAFGIHRNAGDFDEMFAGGKLKEIRNRFVIQFGSCFLSATGKKRDANDQRSQNPQTAESSGFHALINPAIDHTPAHILFDQDDALGGRVLPLEIGFEKEGFVISVRHANEFVDVCRPDELSSERFAKRRKDGISNSA